MDDRWIHIIEATKALRSLTQADRETAVGIAALLDSDEFSRVMTIEKVVEKVVEVPTRPVLTPKVTPLARPLAMPPPAAPKKKKKKIVNRGPFRCFRCRNSYASAVGRDVHMWKAHPRTAKKMGLVIRRWHEEGK